jgi:mannose-6-phosphate isomerase-like protein (cupin superfamily)
VPGTLAELRVRPNAVVRKGDELARLVNVDLDLEIADLEGKERQYESRLKSLERERFSDPAAGLEIGTVEESLAGIREQLARKRQDRSELVLVAPRDKVQDVKALVARLKAQGRYETSLHREVFRPWGSYDSIDGGERFQVKRLVVKPGASMSLQLHHHRAEHWIVVSGTARITRGEETFLLGENESTFIPMGTKHRIENPGKVTLHLIEVQSGSYLGEDDIVRFEDRYGREGSST